MKLEETRNWLLSILADGPAPVAELQAAGAAAGHSWSTIRRASDELGVATEKLGMDGGWQWRLPHDDGGNPADVLTIAPTPTAERLLSSLASKGIDVRLRDDGSLVLSPAGKVSDDLAAQVRERLDDLIALIRESRKLTAEQHSRVRRLISLAISTGSMDAAQVAGFLDDTNASTAATQIAGLETRVRRRVAENLIGDHPDARRVYQALLDIGGQARLTAGLSVAAWDDHSRRDPALEYLQERGLAKVGNGYAVVIPAALPGETAQAAPQLPEAVADVITDPAEAGHIEEPARLGGEALIALAHRFGVARSEAERMPEALLRKETALAIRRFRERPMDAGAELETWHRNLRRT